MCILTLSANKMGVILPGMAEIRSYMATGNIIPLSGELWGMPFC